MKSIIRELVAARNSAANNLRKIDNAIAALGGMAIKPGRRTMPASARRKIAAAQRARWKKWHAAKK
jgi:capsid protein